MFEDLMNDDVYIVDLEGAETGPYKTSFNSKSITIFDVSLNVSEGFKVLRRVPSGKVESYTVIEASFQSALDDFPAGYDLSLSKDSAIRSSVPHTTTNNINITGSQGIQIGNHNSQQFQMMFQDLVSKIDASNGTREQREEAKNLLTQFLTHPLVVAAVGASLPVAIGLMS